MSAAASASEPVVRLEAIEKSYGGQAVLRGVSLTVDAGEMVSLVGRSGSGKSTLLHIAGGLDRGYRGQARVCGVDLAALSDARLARFRNRRVGFVFQGFHLLDHLRVVENVVLPWYFAPAGETHPAALRRARDALDRVGLADHAQRRPAELSGGQKQRVAIARALLHRPDLLLADEPTGNLDSDTGARIIELFGDLNREGLTLLIITHEERVSRAARRLLRLEDGRLVRDAPSERAADGEPAPGERPSTAEAAS